MALSAQHTLLSSAADSIKKRFKGSTLEMKLAERDRAEEKRRPARKCIYQSLRVDLLVCSEAYRCRFLQSFTKAGEKSVGLS